MALIARGGVLASAPLGFFVLGTANVPLTYTASIADVEGGASRENSALGAVNVAASDAGHLVPPAGWPRP